MAASAVLLSACLSGCQRHQPALEGPAEATPVTQSDAGGSAVPADPRLHQAFTDAIRQEAPADWQRPPDLTLTGKSVGKLYTQVVGKVRRGEVLVLTLECGHTRETASWAVPRRVRCDACAREGDRREVGTR